VYPGTRTETSSNLTLLAANLHDTHKNMPYCSVLLFFFCVLYCSLFLYFTVSDCDVRATTLNEGFPCFFLSCKANARV
jgi:hypothetical protein